MKIKRTLSLLLTLIMLIGTLPLTQMTAAADGEVTEYDIWIFGIRVTSETLANRPAAWRDTTYDPVTNTLTIGLEIAPDEGDDPNFGISDYDLAVIYTTMENLNVKGTMELPPTLMIDHCRYGVRSTGNLTIVDNLSISTADFIPIEGASLTYSDDILLTYSSGSRVVYEKADNYDLWVCGVRVNSKNRGSIGGRASFDPETNTLTLSDSPDMTGTYENSVIYSELPTLTVKGDAGIRTNANYAIRTTGALTIDGDLVFIANSCAIAAQTLSFAEGKTLVCPENGTFSNGAVRDANGNTAAVAGTVPYVEYDLWLGNIRVDYVNRVNILGDGKACFDPDTNTLNLSGSPGIDGAHENSAIYSALPALTIKGSSILRTNADYGIRSIGALTFGGDMLFFANSYAIAAQTLSFTDGKTLCCPENGTFSIGAVRDANGNTAAVAGTIPYVEYDLWLGDTRVTSLNRYDINSYRASFDPDTNTLSLKGGLINGAHENSIIYADGIDLTVVGWGAFTGDADYAIRSTGNLTIDGSFTFTANVAAILAAGSLSLGYCMIEIPENGVVINGTICTADDIAATVRIYKPDIFDLWLGSTRVTSANKNDILNDGGKAVFDPSSGTLTLNSPVIEGSMTYEGMTCKILCTMSAVTLEGTYKMPTDDNCDVGIRVASGCLNSAGNFTFRGSRVAVWSGDSVYVRSGKLAAEGGKIGLRTNVPLFVEENASMVSMGGSNDAYQYGYDYYLMQAPPIIININNSLSIVYPTAIGQGISFETGITLTKYATLIDRSINLAARRLIVASDEPELWIGRTKVTESNKNDVLGDGSVSFDPDKNMLTLNSPADGFGYHTLSNGSKCRIYAKNMALTVKGTFTPSLTSTIYHEYGVVVEDGDLTVEGTFNFRGSEVGAIAESVNVKSGVFRAKGDADTAVRTGNLWIGKNVESAYFHGSVSALDTSAVFPYLDWFSCSGEIRNGNVYDGYGNLMTDVTFSRAETFYDLWVGDRRVHNLNLHDVLGDGTVRFDPATNTLTLNGADMTLYDYADHPAWIWFEGFDLTLRGSGTTDWDRHYAQAGIYCPDSHSLTAEGRFDFNGRTAGIYVHDLNVVSGGVSAVGDYGVYLTGKLTVSKDAEYFYACATNENYPVAVETAGSITMSCTCPQILPKNSALETHDYRYASDPDAGKFTSFFLPGASYNDDNGNTVYNLGLRASEVYWGTDYHVTVGDRAVSSRNYPDVFGDGKVSFDPDTNTLTLNNPTIDGSCEDLISGGAKISAKDIDLTVTGSYHMTGDAAAIGIGVDGGSLTLDGDFTFLGTSSAIYAQGDVTLNGTITASVVPGSAFSNAGVQSAQGGVTVLGGSLTAGGGQIGVSCPNGALTIYAPDTESVILDGSEKALYAAGLIFDGNTDDKEFVIAAPHGAPFIAGTIDNSAPGSYSIIPAKHVELLPTSTLGLWVNGKSVNAENYDDIFGNGKAVYDPDTHTLTLTDVEYGGAHQGAVIHAVGFDLTVTGRAKLTGAQYAIKVDGGSLTIDGVYSNDVINGITCSGTVCGISAPEGTLTLTGKVSVYGETTGVLSGGAMTLDGVIRISSASCGVNAGGPLTAGGDIEIYSDDAAIRARSIVFLDSDSIVAPAVWSFDPVGQVVLDANGDAAKNVSIRHIDRYGLWLGSIEVTSVNNADVFGDGRASFDPGTNVLTLHDPTIPGASDTSLGAASKILASGLDLTVRGTYHMASDDGCFFGLQCLGGTLTLDGFFTFRGTLNGLRSDRHVSVGGELTAIATAGTGVGVYISGGASDGLELLPCFITETTVTAEGGDRAVSIGSALLLPQNGLDLIEPAGGRIDYYTKRIYDQGGAESTRAVLRIDRLAAGKGTAAEPFYIMDANNWSAISSEIERGLDTSGLCFGLTSDINVSTMLGTSWYPFSGRFDGDPFGSGANTLTLDLDLLYESDVAPFRFIAGATVRNLIVDGAVTGIGASGLAGRIVGNGSVIENCEVRASVGTQSPNAAGFVLDGGGFSTSLAGCIFSGSVYGFSSQSGFNLSAYYASTLWGGSSAGATVALTDCLDLSASDFPAGRGEGSVTLTNVYYTAASKNASAQSVWNTAKRAYTVTGVSITLTKSAGCGVTYEGAIYAAEGETVGFTTSIGDTALAASDGVLTQNGDAAALTMPAMNVSVYRKTDLKYDIHFTETVTGGIVYPSRVRTYAGDLVRIYRNPKAGYVPDTLTVEDAQNTPIAVQTDENGDPCFIMPAGEVYVTASFKKKYSYNAETGELRLLCGTFGEMSSSRWADGDNMTLINAKSVTAEPGVRFIGGMANLFSSFINCVSFDLHNVDVSGVTSVWRMFYGCRSMTTLNIDGWDLSLVTDAHEMFAGCASLESFRLSALSCAPLTDISGLFSGCSSLSTVDLSALDPAALPDMTDIFSGCPNLRKVTLAPGMSVSQEMALNNNGGGWVAEGTLVLLCDGDGYGTFTATPTETTYKWAIDEFGPRYVFDETTGALTLRWGEFTSDETWEQIRSNKNAVTSVTADSRVSFVGNCDNMFYLFSNCTSIDLSDADVSGMTSMNNMFGYCVSLTQLDVSLWDTSLVTDMANAFQFCTALPSIDCSFRNTGNVEDMTSMFAGCAALTSLDLSGFDTGSLAHVEMMFESCTSLVSVNLSGWDLSRVDSLGNMFGSCESLENLNLTGWNTTNVESMNGMFCGCSSLTSLDLSHFNVSSVSYFDSMFSGCSSLVSLGLSGWDTSAAAYMVNMFSGCSSLESLDLSDFTLVSHYDEWEDEYVEPYVNEMFDGAAALKKIVLPAAFAVTEEMCLQNGDANDPGWVSWGDGTLTVVSGTGEYAVIDAPTATAAFVWKTVIAPDPLFCDLNGDGKVNIGDVTALLNYLAENAATDLKYDLNGDGTVTISDVTELLNILSGK